MTTQPIVSEAPALAPAAIDQLAADVRGAVIPPGDPRYDTARQVHNGMIAKRPALGVRCADVADVIAAVAAARAHGLPLAIRGGGHNAAGLGTWDGGVVADLSGMNGIRVDPRKRTAHVEGGATWGDVDHATHPFSLATPSGIVSTTGVGGLTLGGGFGHLSRRYGLSCDNLLSADVVTADGHFVTASANEHPDLFWALRGGGGNFGVVTSFEFQLHPVDTVVAGPIFYPIDRAEELLRFYRDFIADAPEELSAFFGFHLAPPAPFIPEHLQTVPMALFVVCYSGPVDQSEAALRPFREVVPPAVDLAQPIPYPALQSMFDALTPPGIQYYWKADFDDDLTDEMIDIHLRYGPAVPSTPSLMHLYPLNGAINRVGTDETAFSYRDAKFAHVILAADPDPAPMSGYRAWAREFWSALHPHSAGGAYVNFMMEEGEDRVGASYRGNLPRLQAIKRTYDPTNFFRVNQNIAPAS